MDQTTAIEAARKYAQLVQNFIQPNKIVLFGSYASGKFHEDSDIDVAIIVETLDSNFFDLSIQLSNLTTNIDKRIEPVLLSEKNDPTDFVKGILRQGILLYEKK